MRLLPPVVFLALVLGACHPAPARPPKARDVTVGDVKGAPIVTAPAKVPCGPESDEGLMTMDEAKDLRIRVICIRGPGMTDELRETTKKHLASEVGAKLDPMNIRTDLSHLYERYLFERVDVLARPKDDGVELTYELRPRPIVRGVDLDVPPDFPADDHLHELTGKAFDPADVAHHIEWLREHYPYDGSYTVTRSGDGVRLRVVLERR